MDNDDMEQEEQVGSLPGSPVEEEQGNVEGAEDDGAPQPSKLQGIVAAAAAARAQAAARGGGMAPRGLTPAGLGLRPRFMGAGSNAGATSGPGRGQPSKMQLLVSNLPPQAQEKNIQAIFKQARIPVARVHIPEEGSALVDILIPGSEDREVAADFAVHRVSGNELSGYTLQVDVKGPVEMPVLPQTMPAADSSAPQRPFNPLAALTRLKEAAMANRAAASPSQGKGAVAARLEAAGATLEGHRRKTALCTYWKENRCTKGEQCAFAHGEHELSQNQQPTPAERLRKIAELRGLRPGMSQTQTPWGAQKGGHVVPPAWGKGAQQQASVDQWGQPIPKYDQWGQPVSADDGWSQNDGWATDSWGEDAWAKDSKGGANDGWAENDGWSQSDAWSQPKSLAQEMRDRIAAAKGGKGGKDAWGGTNAWEDGYEKDPYGKGGYGKGAKGGKDAWGGADAWDDGYAEKDGYEKDPYGKGGYGKDGYGKDAYGKDGKGKGADGKGKGEGRFGGKWGGKGRVARPRPDRKGRAPLLFEKENSLAAAERVKAQVVEAGKDQVWNPMLKAYSRVGLNKEEEPQEEDKASAFLLNEDGVPYLFETYGLGAQLLVGMGWSPGGGVGKSLTGRIEPISVQVLLEPTTHFGRRDRRCLGVPAPAEFQDSEKSDDSADAPPKEDAADSRHRGGERDKRPGHGDRGGRGDRDRGDRGDRGGRRERSRSNRRGSRSRRGGSRRRKFKPRGRSARRGPRSRSNRGKPNDKDTKGREARRDDKKDDKKDVKKDETKDGKKDEKKEGQDGPQKKDKPKSKSRSRKRSKSSSSSSRSSSSRSRGKKKPRTPAGRKGASKGGAGASSAAGASPASAAAAAKDAEGAAAKEPPEIAQAKKQVLAKLTVLKNVEPKEQRMKEFRQMLREWHPDKNPERIDMATAVFQFLQKGKSLLNLK